MCAVPPKLAGKGVDANMLLLALRWTSPRREMVPSVPEKAHFTLTWVISELREGIKSLLDLRGTNTSFSPL